MTGPFRPAELIGADVPLGQIEQAELLGVARELEAAAIASEITPSAAFSERVLIAIAVEPLPQPVAALGWAARHGRFRAFVDALGDTWRLAWSGGRPLAARAEAIAVLAVLVLAAASMTGLAVNSAAGLLGQPGVTLPSSTGAAPSPLSSPAASPEPVATPEPSPSVEPTPTPRRSTPRPTALPTETPEGTDDDGTDDHSDGNDGSGSGDEGGESESEASGRDELDEES